MELVYSLSEIAQVAAKCWESFGKGAVVAFHGPMGAGKTTLISALCKARGITTASSPTFSIINEYQAQDGSSLFHLDLYRLNNTAEAIGAGVEDVLFSGDTCFIEWPEKAPELLPASTIHCTIELVNDQQRKLKILQN
jgi:tRNA threonylcarbamoyladenosine biosynthesis protein TsaE